MYVFYAIRSPEVCSPALIRWLRDPDSFYLYVICRVDLCVHYCCLLVKGTVISLVLSSTFMEGKRERGPGAFSTNLYFLFWKDSPPWPELCLISVPNCRYLKSGTFFLSGLSRRERQQRREIGMAFEYTQFMVFATVCKPFCPF